MSKPSVPRKPYVGYLGAVFIDATLFFGLGWQSGFAVASTVQNAPDLCIAAAQNAADRTGVPVSVLLAITLTETGRSTENGLRPWPWAINQAGEGHWFQTPEDAIQFAEEQLDLGLRNFDVGCFQLNHRWHSKGFTSTTDMFDPTSNALYAAKFLGDLYNEVGDWSLAAARYHSRTPEYADRYQAKFESILANLSDGAALETIETISTPRMNHFPLLMAGSKGNAGSLVPFLSAGIPLIGQQP